MHEVFERFLSEWMDGVEDGLARGTGCGWGQMGGARVGRVRGRRSGWDRFVGGTGSMDEGGEAEGEASVEGSIRIIGVVVMDVVSLVGWLVTSRGSRMSG